jgi:conjugative transposon TraM protein
MKTHSQKFLQQRRFYMVLPLLVFPFLTMIFWALGGGKGGQAQAQEMKSGLNMELPGAHFNKEDELWDKFSLYEQAKRDSIKQEEAKRNDPYYVVTTLRGINADDTLPDDKSKLNTSLGSKDKYAQINKDEKEINQRIEQLTKQISSEETKSPVPVKSIIDVVNIPSQVPSSDEVDRLEKMMQLMNGEGSNDPEMQQIDGMLEKILDIQHPDRAKEKLREQSRLHEQQVYAVVPPLHADNISLVEGITDQPTVVNSDSIHTQTLAVNSNQGNAFYGLGDEPEIDSEAANAIEAVIHDTQTVVAGSTVKMRLLSDVYIKGQLIKKDQFIYGVCAISGERLTISISSVRNEHSLYPVALDVYDLDGMQGIYIPGAISRDVAKQASAQSIEDIQMYSMNNSLEVQAATAGIEAAKGMFSKKAKLIKVTVKAGYQILLKGKNQSAS